MHCSNKALDAPRTVDLGSSRASIERSESCEHEQSEGGADHGESPNCPPRSIDHSPGIFIPEQFGPSRAASTAGLGCGKAPGIKSGVLRSSLENDLNRSRDATTMFTNTKFVLSVAIMLGAASTAQAAAQPPTERPTGSIVQRQVPTSAYASDSVAPAPGQITRMTAEYFDPNPATFKAFTYCASVPLGPSISKRALQGKFRFPAFSATPNVSVQIISSTAAAPMQVYALRIEEISGISGAVETQIVVEAETIFDVPANGMQISW